MADLGTSGGLQGIYQGDSAQNRPAYIKPKPNTFGDDIIAEMDKQEKRKKDEQDAFDKQLDPFISIDGTKYLPERVPLVKEQSQKVLQEAMKVRGKKGNVMLDENVSREVTKLQELQNKYTREATIANDFQKKMLTDQAFEYDDATKEEVAKAIEGRAGLDDKKYISSDYIDKGRNFSKYRKPEDRAKFLAYYTPNAGEKITTRVMQNGVYVDKVIEGSQIYETPEGVASQRERFYNLAKTSQSPFVRGWMREAEEGINANDDLVFQENFKDLTPLQAQDFIAQRAADLMIEDAKNTNKLKTGDRTTRIPTGSNLEMNFGGGRYKTKTGDYQFDVNQKDTTDEQRYDNYLKRNLPTFIENYVKSGKGTEEEANAFYQTDAGKEGLKKGFEMYYDKSPNVVGVTVSSTQKQDDLNPSYPVIDSQGKAIDLIPVRWNINTETNKPTSVYGFKRVKKTVGNKSVTELEAVTVPYNINTKGLNAVAPDIANLYEEEYGKKLNLIVEGGEKSNTFAPMQRITRKEAEENAGKFVEGEQYYIDGVLMVFQDEQLKKVKR